MRRIDESGGVYIGGWNVMLRSDGLHRAFGVCHSLCEKKVSRHEYEILDLCAHV